jgi:Domain of unknown function (DUF4920)
MKVRWFILLSVLVLLSSAGCQNDDGGSATETAALAVAEIVGNGISVDAATSLTVLLEKPQELLSQVVMVEGTVTARCQGEGCWITLDTGDAENPFYVKSDDQSFIFPEDCVGKKIRVQGEVKVYQSEHDHAHGEGEADHACPAPIYYVDPAGAEVLK